MIILSGVLVVVAIALLGAAIVPGIIAGDGETAQVLGLDALMVIYLSIAVSVVSALCLAIGVFLRRKELFGAASAAKKGKTKGRTRKKPARAPAAAGRGRSAPLQPGKTGDSDDTVTILSPPAEVPGEAVVFVVRGRKRYHLDTCRQLAGRDREELTYAEAKEEGFSSCTACMPDTALAARAAVAVSAAPAEKAPAKAKGTGRAAATAPLPTTAEPDERLPTPAPSGTGTGETAKAAPEPPTGHLEAPSPETALPKAQPPGTLGAPTARPSVENAGPPGFGSDPLDTGAPFAGQGGADRLPGSGRPGADAPLPQHPADAPSPETFEAGDSAADDVPVKILSGTRRYHRPGCALLEDIGDHADDLDSLTRGEAKARDCTPCLVCRPDDPA